MLTIIISKIKKQGILIPLAILMALVGCGKPTDHVEVGQALLAQGKVEDASIEFKKAIEKNPDSAEAYFSIAFLNSIEASSTLP